MLLETTIVGNKFLNHSIVKMDYFTGNECRYILLLPASYFHKSQSWTFAYRKLKRKIIKNY